MCFILASEQLFLSRPALDQEDSWAAVAADADAADAVVPVLLPAGPNSVLFFFDIIFYFSSFLKGQLRSFHVCIFLLSCIPPDLHPSSPASLLPCILPVLPPVLHPTPSIPPILSPNFLQITCPGSLLSSIPPVPHPISPASHTLHPTYPESLLSCIPPVLHPSCPAYLLSCLPPVLPSVCPAFRLSCLSLPFIDLI